MCALVLKEHNNTNLAMFLIKKIKHKQFGWIFWAPWKKQNRKRRLDGEKRHLPLHNVKIIHREENEEKVLQIKSYIYSHSVQFS